MSAAAVKSDNLRLRQQEDRTQTRPPRRRSCHLSPLLLTHQPRCASVPSPSRRAISPPVWFRVPLTDLQAAVEDALVALRQADPDAQSGLARDGGVLARDAAQRVRDQRRLRRVRAAAIDAAEAGRRTAPRRRRAGRRRRSHPAPEPVPLRRVRRRPVCRPWPRPPARRPGCGRCRRAR